MAWRSMTGFGMATSEICNSNIDIYIRSTNHKSLHVVFRGNFMHAPIQNELEQRIKGVVKRGMIEVELRKFINRYELFSMPSKEVLAQLKKDLVSLASELEFKPNIEFLEFLEFVIKTKVTERQGLDKTTQENLLKMFDAALLQWNNSCKNEANNLLSQISGLLIEIISNLERIKLQYGEFVGLYAQQLVKKYEEIIDRKELSEDELTRLSFGYVERYAIDEELTRANSHIARIKELLNTNVSQGRALEFYAQELFREVNTMSSKSISGVLTGYLVNIKCAIEKIKEQVQNLE